MNSYTKQAATTFVNRFLVTIPVAAGAALVLFLGMTGGEQKEEAVFHVTLANPSQYAGGVYTEVFSAAPGTYSLSFVPNGDSPTTLAISITGTGVAFSEEYTLNGILHDTGISQYYTWEYQGHNTLSIPLEQQLTITIDPRGEILGPVSVSLVKN